MDLYPWYLDDSGSYNGTIWIWESRETHFNASNAIYKSRELKICGVGS